MNAMWTKTLTMAAVFGLVNVAWGVTTLVTTPPLHAATGTHVCRVISTNASQVAVTIKLINTATATIDCQQGLNIPGINGSVQVSCSSPPADRYCEVDATSGTIANNLTVSLLVQDTASNALAAVRGQISGTTTISSIQYTPGLSSTQILTCSVVNPGSPPVIAEILLMGDNGSFVGGSNIVTLNPGRGIQASVSVTPPAGVFCQASSDSDAHAKQLRASLYSQSGSGDSLSAVQGQ